MRVLMVGGGSGGGSGNAGGGGSGHVQIAEIDIQTGSNFSLTIGRGGRGSTFKLNDSSQNALPGGQSSFGAYLKAEGGVGSNPFPCSFTGTTGGSGGGAGCSGSCWSGNGGSGGSQGNNSKTGVSLGPGFGQGIFLSNLSYFKLNSISAGEGGNGIVREFPGGGGGGGILINRNGPNAKQGQNDGAYGGKGYGAGGGAGWVNRSSDGSQKYYYAGGDGADGLIYIEWWWDVIKDKRISFLSTESSKSGNLLINNNKYIIMYSIKQY